jgi:mandelamide amidase
MTRMHELTVTEARSALVRGDFSCKEYVAALLARSEAAADINALVAQDPEALLAAAAQMDDSGAARDAALPLGGIPIALKDNIDTLALPTTGCTGALQGRRPAGNAPVAQALFDGGALLGGKANMHELAFGISCNNALTGPTRNPYDKRMIPGGSSGGSAAAVAARMFPASLGTDTGASVRLPAALCGVIGFRPTVGRYPGQGIIPISHTRDTPGPIARSMADIRLLDGILASDGTPPEAVVSLKGLRLGLPLRYFFGGADPQVSRVIDAALALLREAGVDLVEAEVESLQPLNDAVGFPVALYELQHDLPAYLARAGYPMTLAEVAAGISSPDVAGIVSSQLGEQAVPRAAYEAALAARVQLQAAYFDYFTGHRLDAMIFPTAILPARPIGDDLTVELNGEQVPTFFTFIRNTDPGSNAGIPGISLPAGLTSEGLPVGIELDGPGGSDRRLLAIAAALEAILPRLPAPVLA